MSIPATVNLGGQMFRVQHSEGLVVFAESGNFWGVHCRISFERRSSLWYVALDSTFGVPVSKVAKAFAFVEEWFGGDFANCKQTTRDASDDS